MSQERSQDPALCLELTLLELGFTGMRCGWNYCVCAVILYRAQRKIRGNFTLKTLECLGWMKP